MEVIRATETYQQAGAYYVRIQAMAKKHHITLRQEFDEHDTPETKYIVILDNDFPIATARIYQIDNDSIMLGKLLAQYCLNTDIKESVKWLYWNVRSGLLNWAIKKLCLKVGITR